MHRYGFSAWKRGLSVEYRFGYVKLLMMMRPRAYDRLDSHELRRPALDRQQGVPLIVPG